MWGQGNLELSNGEKYQGEFQEGNFHGEGFYTNQNGDIFHGFWRHGVLEKELDWLLERGIFIIY